MSRPNRSLGLWNRQKGHPKGLCEVDCKKRCPHITGEAFLSCPWRAKQLGIEPEGVTIRYAEV